MSSSAAQSNIRALLSAILHAHNPADARMFRDKLRGADHGGVADLQDLIDNGERLADSIIAALERDAVELQQSIKTTRFQIDMESEKLAYELQRQNIWTKEELAAFESIDPNKMYKVPKIDANGKLVAGEAHEISGTQIRKSMSIVKAYGNQDKLDAKGKQALKEAMGSGGIQTVKDAVKDVTEYGIAQYPESSKIFTNRMNEFFVNPTPVLADNIVNSALLSTPSVRTSLQTSEPQVPDTLSVPAPSAPLPASAIAAAPIAAPLPATPTAVTAPPSPNGNWSNATAQAIQFKMEALKLSDSLNIGNISEIGLDLSIFNFDASGPSISPVKPEVELAQSTSANAPKEATRVQEDIRKAASSAVAPLKQATAASPSPSTATTTMQPPEKKQSVAKANPPEGTALPSSGNPLTSTSSAPPALAARSVGNIRQ